jgi:Fur family transcriptional regulator, ferric uptake regulator
MCQRCDYATLLESAGLGFTPSRLQVLEIIGNSTSPLSAQEIFSTLERTMQVNRVTLYRILDLLVEYKLVERITAGDRSFRYGLAENSNHPPHHHFFCTLCGAMECLNPHSISLDLETFHTTFPALIEKVELRLDGICINCLRQQRTRLSRDLPGTSKPG